MKHLSRIEFIAVRNDSILKCVLFTYIKLKYLRLRIIQTRPSFLGLVKILDMNSLSVPSNAYSIIPHDKNLFSSKDIMFVSSIETVKGFGTNV